MPDFRFSPILDQQRFETALDYLAVQTVVLAQRVLGRELPIDTLTLFAHSGEEYAFLDKLLRRYGPESSVTHGVTLYIDSDFDIRGYHIQFLGVRQPDPTRSEVGYADYPVDDYPAILTANYPGVHEIISGRAQHLLEVTHPDFDVRGYIVDKAGHDA